MRDIRVVVGIPSTGVWTSEFGLSMIQMVADIGGENFEGIKSLAVSWLHHKSSILPNAREHLMEEAIEGNATHLLFLDSDQSFPPFTLRRLLSHERVCVAANIATKMLPSGPTARDRNGKPVFTRLDSKGLESVWRVGCGIMLVELEKIKAIPRPWFPMRFKSPPMRYQGEDWGFCERLEGAKIPIFVDHDLSLCVGHVGSLTYNHGYVPEAEDEAGNSLDSESSAS